MGIAFYPASKAKARVNSTSTNTRAAFAVPAAASSSPPSWTWTTASEHRAGVLVIPGGGYSFVSLDYEGADTVRFLNARGLDAWVLDYTTTCAAPAPLYPAPLDEAADAVRAIRACLDQQESQGSSGSGSSSDGSATPTEHAAAAAVAMATAVGVGVGGAGRQIQQQQQRYRLGVWGFSAGAHLAALTLTRPDIEPLLDFAVLAYPVVSMTSDDNDGDIVVAHLGSRRNLLGDGTTGHGSLGGGGGGVSAIDARGPGTGTGTGGRTTPTPSGATSSRSRSQSGASVAATVAAAAAAAAALKKEKEKEAQEQGGRTGTGAGGTEEAKGKKEEEKDDPFADVPELQRRMSPHRAVGPRTPPVFIFHTANDPAVPVQNALLFAGAMARHARPFQLLVLPDGPHGVSLALDDPKLSWTNELDRWLRYSVGVVG
ncbi:hypothetical protein SLS62_002159 [Diatrype stigma]|uniref:Peptidase S9 prolyl oligopeptidase catalytic domain-containing protein n=1 Tax=Diatrype stigma TaxID=117547 RepID=A0AAN9UZA0_9PEZI